MEFIKVRKMSWLTANHTASRVDQEIFNIRGPDSRDDYVFNAGRTKLLCEQKREGRPLRLHKNHYALLLRNEVLFVPQDIKNT